MELQRLIDALQSGVGSESLLMKARDTEFWKTIQGVPGCFELVNELKEEKTRFLAEPIRVLPYSLLKLFQENGSRREYEREYFDRRARLNTFAILTLMEGGAENISALEDVVWAICEEYTWCLPAHLPGARVEEADYLAVRSPGLRLTEEPIALDLFAAETAFALAEILSLLEGKIAPVVIQRGRNEVIRRVLVPYQTLVKPMWWETTRMNWAAVCAGSIGAAAMYLIEDILTLAPLIQRVLDTMDCFLQGFGGDGATPEGPGYWTYGFGFFIYFAALLKERTAGTIDLFQNAHVKQIALFQQKFYLTGNCVASFSDSALSHNYQTGLTCYLKTHYADLWIPENKYRAKLRDDGSRRWAHAIRDLVWYDSHLESGPLPLRTDYFPDAQWLISRAGTTGHGVCLAAKGGHNDEPHNHNDVGSFIVHCDGHNLLADLGRGVYTRQYFGPERYQFLCAGSQGHSVPIIDGEFQKQGPIYAARSVNVNIAEERDVMTMDISKAYGIANLKSLVRTLSFKKTGALQVVLRDDYQFAQTPGQVVERLISFFEPRIVSDGTIRIQGGNSGIDIKFDHPALHPEISREPFDTHEGETMDVFIIDFNVKSPSQRFITEFIIKMS